MGEGVGLCFLKVAGDFNFGEWKMHSIFGILVVKELRVLFRTGIVSFSGCYTMLKTTV
jgi:hypothetical protein